MMGEEKKTKQELKEEKRLGRIEAEAKRKFKATLRAVGNEAASSSDGVDTKWNRLPDEEKQVSH